MRSLYPILLCTALLLGCSDGDEPLQGYEEADVEIVSEGSAPGTTRQVVAPGEAATLTAPMTGTNIDTTTDLDMIADENLPVESPDGVDPRDTLLDDFDRPAPVTATPSSPGATRSPSPSPALSSSRPARVQPEPEPVRRPQPTPEPAPVEPAPEPEPQPLPERKPLPEPEQEPEPERPQQPENEPQEDDEDPPPIIDRTPPDGEGDEGRDSSEEDSRSET